MTFAERFRSKTIPEPNSGGVLWLARVDRDGYGEIKVPPDKAYPPRWPRLGVSEDPAALYKQLAELDLQIDAAFARWAELEAGK